MPKLDLIHYLTAIPLTLCPLPQVARDVIFPSPLVGEGDTKGDEGYNKSKTPQLLIENAETLAFYEFP